MSELRREALQEAIRHFGKQCSCLGPGDTCGNCRMRAELVKLLPEEREGCCVGCGEVAGLQPLCVLGAKRVDNSPPAEGVTDE